MSEVENRLAELASVELATQVLMRTRPAPGLAGPDLACETALACRDLLADHGVECLAGEYAPGAPAVLGEMGGDGGPTLVFHSRLDTRPATAPQKWDHPWNGAMPGGRDAGMSRSILITQLTAALALRRAGITFAGRLILAFAAGLEARAFQVGAEETADPMQRTTAPSLDSTEQHTVWIRLQSGEHTGQDPVTWAGANAMVRMGHVLADLNDWLVPLITHNRYPYRRGTQLSIGLVSGGIRVTVLPEQITKREARRTLPPENCENVAESMESMMRRLQGRFGGFPYSIEVMSDRALGSALSHANVVRPDPAEADSSGDFPTVVIGPNDTPSGRAGDGRCSLSDLAEGARVLAVAAARVVAAGT